MGDLNIDQIVNVVISLETQFPTRKGFGTANIVGTGTVIPESQRLRIYTSIAGVADDFATSSEEYKAAQIAFSQDPRPTRIAISRANTSNGSGQLITAAPAALASLLLISDGSFAIAFDGGAVTDILALNFTGETTYDGIATVIQTALQTPFAGSTCVWTGSGFVLGSPTTGASSTASFLTAAASGTDISGPAGLNGLAGSGSITVDGYAYVDLGDELNRIEALNADWYGFSLTRDHGSVADQLAASAWAEARTKVFFCQDSALDVFSLLGNSITEQLKVLDYNRTYTQWHQVAEQYAELAAMIIGLSEDFTPNSALTLKFKDFAGISPVDITETQRIVAQGENANVYVTVGGNPMNQEGVMASAEFFDIIHGRDWLQNAIATNVFGLLYVATTKVPYTDAGIAAIENQVKSALDEAVAANFIASDIDDSGALIPAYTLTFPRALAQPVADRSARQYKQGAFSARVSGAIHFTDINGTLTV